jgi:hypothetical protein
VRQTPSQQHPIRVAIHVADRALRARMTRVLEEAGNFASAGLGDADVTIADRPPDQAGPVIALVPAVPVPFARAAAWRSDVRAVLPADVDATALAAVITVIRRDDAQACDRGAERAEATVRQATSERRRQRRAVGAAEAPPNERKSMSAAGITAAKDAARDRVRFRPAGAARLEGHHRRSQSRPRPDAPCLPC